MAWNGSVQRDESPSATRHRASTRHVLWWCLGIVSLVGVGVILLFFAHEDRNAPPFRIIREDGRRRVSVAPPLLTKADYADSHTPTPRAEAEDELTPSLSGVPAKKATWAQLYGRGIAVTNDFTGGKSKYEISRRRSENELLFLTCAPVGTMIIGNTDYDEDFIADLKDALNEETVIDPADDEERATLRRQLIAVKKELKQRLAQGDDLAEVLSQTRSDLQDLGVYKSQIEQQIVDFQSEGDEKTDEDVESFVMAANLMLEEKGIEPFHFNAITKEILKHKPLDVDLETGQ